MGISNLTVTPQHSDNWNASNNITGDDYNPVTNAGRITNQQALGTSVANAALGGADEIVSFIQTMAATASATIDCTSLTNILQQTGVSLARIKAFRFRLLNTTNDATNGTACTSISIGNASTNGQLLGLSPATATKDLFSGGDWSEFDARTTGYTVDATHKNIKILNNDSSRTAAVQITLIGGTT